MTNERSFSNGFRHHILTLHQVPTPVPLSHGMTRATLMTHRLVMATFQMTLRKKKPSSITVTTSAARLTLLMIKPTSRSMMLTCRTESCWLMSIVAVKTYRTSSTANSSMRKLACTIMVQGT